jgi:hypothetical protein
MAFSLTTLLFQGCTKSSHDDVKYEEKISGYKGPAAVNPWLAAARMLDQLGIPAQTRQSIGTLPEPGTAVFIAAGAVASRGAALQMLTWASRGGHLIVACTGTDRFHNDWAENDDFEDSETRAVSPLLQELSVSFADKPPASPIELSFQDADPVTLKGPEPVGLDLHHRHTDLLAGTDSSAALASFPWSNGRVTLLGSATPFRNRFIANADNAAILYQLVSLESSRSIAFIVAGKTNLWGMLMEYAWMPLVAVVLLIALWLWRHLPGFGPSRPADHSSVRHFGTQLDEAGAFLSDRAGHDALLAPARRSVLQAAAQRGVHVEGENLSENLAARSGIPVAAIDDALHNHSDSGDLIAAAATLQKLQQSLGVTL